MRLRCEPHPRSKRSAKLVLSVDGKDVSGLSVHAAPMRIGSAEVHMGGIGGVWTDRHHRRKGYASIVMSESIDWMRERGFDVSVLFGIPDFYYRWGFITTLSRPAVTVPTRYAETVKRTCRVRALRDADLAGYLRIYNRENAKRTASIVRRKSSWITLRMGLQWGEKPTAFACVKGGTLVGVAAYTLRPDMVACVDLCARTPEAYGGLLHHAAALAVERRVEKIAFHIPTDHAFADFCREQGCAAEVNTPRCSGGMARIINQQQTFAKAAAALSERVAATHLATWSGTVDVATDLETTRLVVKRGKVSLGKPVGRARVKLRCPQERLTQLLFGFQSIAFLRAHGTAKLTGRGAEDVIDALFPKGEPFMWIPDHF